MKHGMTGTRIYQTWHNMKSRCHKEYDSKYKYYGGKGIKVCDEWRNNFNAFYEWAMANGYTDELTIDRIDSSKDYCPENCRWVSMEENQALAWGVDVQKYAQNKKRMIKLNEKFNQAEYDKANTTRYQLKLNNQTDADIIKKLSTVKSKQGYIKECIRKDLENHK